MSDAPPQTRRWEFRAYHETPEHAALAENPVIPPEPRSVAREQLAQMIHLDGHVIEFDSIREEHSDAVIVDDMGEWRPVLDGETPTGHIVLWSASGHPRRPTDGDDPILDGEPDGTDLIFRLPEPLARTGGSARLRHRLGGEVTALAYRADDSPIGYLFATTLDRDTVHAEFFPGTAYFRVSLDG